METSGVLNWKPGEHRRGDSSGKVRSTLRRTNYGLARLGQGSFRLIVLDSYQRRCAFTNSPVLHVLDAAHIKPYALGGTHAPENGLLLRQDLHTLFDRGYVTVTPDHHVEISQCIKQEFDNGK